MLDSCFVVVSPGLEQAALKEALEVGLVGATLVPGGIEIAGGLEAGMRACLWLRVATSVRLRLARFRARDREELRRGLRAVDWNAWLPSNEAAEVTSSSRKSKLYHTGLLNEELARAAGRELNKGTGGLHLRLERDQAELTLDLAGQRLHQRGWRKEGGAAPLRETLAAGILRLVDWHPEEPLLDPMCGSGTIPIEAALIASRRAPGLSRSFAFEQLPAFRAQVWRSLLAQAEERALEGAAGTVIVGSDKNGGAIGAAKRNAERAGVEGLLKLERALVEDCAPPASGPGLLVANPPYGGRIGGRTKEVIGAYEVLGKMIKRRLSGWRAFVLAPSRELALATGLQVADCQPLDNGGIRVGLYRLL